MLENGATWNQLEELLTWLLEKYNLQQGDEEVETETSEEDGSPK
jgi:hypothetical protein